MMISETALQRPLQCPPKLYFLTSLRDPFPDHPPTTNEVISRVKETWVWHEWIPHHIRKQIEADLPEDNFTRDMKSFDAMNLYGNSQHVVVSDTHTVFHYSGFTFTLNTELPYKGGSKLIDDNGIVWTLGDDRKMMIPPDKTYTQILPGSIVITKAFSYLV